MSGGNGPGSETHMAAEKAESGETSWLERRLRQRREKAEGGDTPRRGLWITAIAVAVLYAGVLAWIGISGIFGGNTLPAPPEVVIALNPEPPAPPASPSSTDGLLRERAGEDWPAVPPLTLPPSGDRPGAVLQLDPVPAPEPEPAAPEETAQKEPGPEALPKAPLDGLTAEGKYGPLPVIGPDGKRPWTAYARPQPPVKGPAVALVIGGLGISESATLNAIENLPPEVTLAFAPYGDHIQRWIDRARAAGHEVLLELPMEPFDYPNNDPGPYTLLTNAEAAGNLDRLSWLMSRFTGYAGVAPYQGARFTAEQEAMAPVMEALSSRGLAYLDLASLRRSVAGDLARENAMPFAKGDRLIDPSLTGAVIGASLKSLMEDAKATGTSIGTGSGFPVTVEKVSEWIGTLEEAGIELIPVTAAIERKMEKTQ